MILPMENTEKMIFPGVGKYGIPEIKPETDIRIDKLEWIPVNYALTAKDKATKGVHFYKDDYQFERFWNNPDKYISPFAAVRRGMFAGFFALQRYAACGTAFHALQKALAGGILAGARHPRHSNALLVRRAKL